MNVDVKNLKSENALWTLENERNERERETERKEAQIQTDKSYIDALCMSVRWFYVAIKELFSPCKANEKETLR